MDVPLTELEWFGSAAGHRHHCGSRTITRKANNNYNWNGCQPWMEAVMQATEARQHVCRKGLQETRSPAGGITFLPGLFTYLQKKTGWLR